MVLVGPSTAALIFLLAVSQVRSDDSPTVCSLTEKQVENLFTPVLSFIWNEDSLNSGEVEPLPLECTNKTKAVFDSMLRLIKCGRIIQPDELKDNKILENRFDAFVQSFIELREASDSQTTSYLNKAEPELLQSKNKIIELKDTPEYRMLRLIFSDEAEEAANKTELQENRVEFARRVVELGYDPSNTTFLTLLIEYTFEFDNYDLSINGYEQILQHMNQSGHLETPELLQFGYCVNEDMENDEFRLEPEAIKERYRQLQQKYSKPKQDLIQKMVDDIEEKNFTRFQIFREYDPDILSLYLPEIIQKAYSTGNLTKVPNIIKMIAHLPSLPNDCIAFEAMHAEMEKLEQDGSVEAFALWLLVLYETDNNETFEKIDEDMKKKCLHVKKTLAEHKERHVQDYVKLVQEKQLNVVQELHLKFTVLRQIIPEVVEKVYQGEKGNIPVVTSWVNELPYIEDNCVALEALVERLQTSNQIETSEAVVAFTILRDTIKEAMRKGMESDRLRKCEVSKNLAPEWIRFLLWSKTSSCTLSNRKYNEPLVSRNETINPTDPAGVNTVFTLTTKESEQKWQIIVNKDGYVSFKDRQNPSFYLSHNRAVGKPFASKIGDDRVISGSMKWRIENAKGDFYYIFFHEDETSGASYLSAGSGICSETSYRCVEIDSKSEGQNVQWEIAC